MKWNQMIEAEWKRQLCLMFFCFLRIHHAGNWEAFLMQVTNCSWSVISKFCTLTHYITALLKNVITPNACFIKWCEYQGARQHYTVGNIIYNFQTTASLFRSGTSVVSRANYSVGTLLLLLLPNIHNEDMHGCQKKVFFLKVMCSKWKDHRDFLSQQH